LSGSAYERQTSTQFPDLGLGLTLWEGTYEGKHDTWLRWTDADGAIIATGKERAEQERQRAEQEWQRAEQAELGQAHEHQRAEQERLAKEHALQQLEQEQQRAERLAAMLRQLGQDPTQL
jgi:hypothetical protein